MKHFFPKLPRSAELGFDLDIEGGRGIDGQRRVGRALLVRGGLCRDGCHSLAWPMGCAEKRMKLTTWAAREEPALGLNMTNNRRQHSEPAETEATIGGRLLWALYLNRIGLAIIKPATEKVLPSPLLGVEDLDWEGGSRSGNRNDSVLT